MRSLLGVGVDRLCGHRPEPERPPARDHVPARIRQLLRGVGNLLAADCACRAATLGMPTVAAQAQRLINGSAMASAEPLTPTERQVAELVAQG